MVKEVTRTILIKQYLQLLVLQVIRIVWNAWRSFVPQIQDKRQVKGRAAAHWQRRALILSFAWWHEYAAAISSQRQQLAEALMRWDTRRLSLALEGWHTLTRHKQRRQEQLVQVCVMCAMCWQGKLHGATGWPQECGPLSC